MTTLLQMGKSRPEALDLGLLHRDLHFFLTLMPSFPRCPFTKVCLRPALKVSMLFQGFLEELMLGAVLGPWGGSYKGGPLYLLYLLH